MKLFVGLGNPGEKYEKTRHNLGFVVVTHFLQDFAPVKDTTWEASDKLKSEIARIAWKPKVGSAEQIVLLKPQTHMNNSGMAVALAASFYKVLPEDIWVMHDELDLPLGSMKIRQGGSSAGHRGIESIMQQLGTEMFWRFRLGIGEARNHHEVAGQKMHNVDEYVLGEFATDQAGKIRELVKRSAKALAQALEEGIASAQNQFNTK